MEERLQKILARAGIASRRKVEEMIQQGLVTVNGQLAGIGDKADPERDAIKVEGRRIQPHTGEYHYLLLNKPKGVMSTLSDPEGRPTVIEFIPPALRKALVPVGRLDYYTEGLILLTDDGEFAQRVAHPRYGSVKTYEVKVKGRPSETQLDRLRAGIQLEGRKTAPAKIASRPSPVAHRRRKDDDEGGENTWWVVQLTEGRTRQIREMFQHIGHPVQKLRRVSIGPLRDPDLPLGAVRELTPKEVQSLMKSASEKPPRPKRPAPPGTRGPAAKKPAPKKAPAKKPVSGKAVAKRSPRRPGKK
ncbi:MAG TPA: pseudouridine synthase [Thermoanaerobaculia bacterium]|jgi:23S rRNA pseudouridine2605 synthase|nr:pseudouridine synthase [Thermoanaerobaculia bacterium]